MSKQTAANVNFISHISEKSCTWNYYFLIPTMQVFTSPKMRISRGPPVQDVFELTTIVAPFRLLALGPKT